MQRAHLDANSTYGLLPEVQSRVQQLLSRMAAGAVLNPSSIHSGGQQAKLIIEEARESVRALVKAPNDARVIFTSGATEANNWVLAAAAAEAPGGAIVTTAIEHHSVLEPVERLERNGRKVIRQEMGRHGITLGNLPDIARETEVGLVSCMLANNETGELLPVAKVAAALREHLPNVFIHTDATQAAGKIAVDFEALGVDAMTISSHKIGGLPGAGALILREGSKLPPLLLGGAQEGRERAGTENVAGIAAFGYAAEIVRRDLSKRGAAMLSHSELIRERICEAFPSAILVRELAVPRLPNTICLRLPGIRADDLVVAADLRGVAISSGAACASGKQLPSHVLMALGLSESEARECIRISVRAEDSKEQMSAAADALVDAILSFAGDYGVRAHYA